MVVPVTDGSKNAIGLVAVSSMRGMFHNAPGEGQGTFWLTRLFSTFTLDEPKACIGYAYNGHTAMMARIDGTVAAVVGWNPKSYLTAQIETIKSGVMGTKNRFTCEGKWYNDATMIYDPTAISLEIPVSDNDVDRFANGIRGLIDSEGLGGGRFEYTFLPAEMESNTHPFVGQCTELALVVLCTWLYEFRDQPGCTELREALFNMANSQNMNERNLLQGRMMQFISRWNGEH